MPDHHSKGLQEGSEVTALSDSQYCVSRMCHSEGYMELSGCWGPASKHRTLNLVSSVWPLLQVQDLPEIVRPVGPDLGRWVVEEGAPQSLRRLR